jgi:uncharacterized membrane protein YhdT
MNRQQRNPRFDHLWMQNAIIISYLARKEIAMADRYLKNLLGENEKILLETRQHWFVLLRNILVEGVLIVAIIALVSAILTLTTDYEWVVICYLLVIPPIISGLFDFFQWFNRKYIITNLRVIQISGVVNKDVIDSSLEKVNDVKLTQSFFGRIFNFGHVEILTASEMGTNLFKMIGNPVHFKTTMLNSKSRLDSDGFRQQQNFGDVPTLLAQLDNLRKFGLISEEEFQKKKEDLIRRM